MFACRVVSQSCARWTSGRRAQHHERRRGAPAVRSLATPVLPVASRETAGVKSLFDRTGGPSRLAHGRVSTRLVAALRRVGRSFGAFSLRAARPRCNPRAIEYAARQHERTKRAPVARSLATSVHLIASRRVVGVAPSFDRTDGPCDWPVDRVSTPLVAALRWVGRGGPVFFPRRA